MASTVLPNQRLNLHYCKTNIYCKKGQTQRYSVDISKDASIKNHYCPSFAYDNRIGISHNRQSGCKSSQKKILLQQEDLFSMFTCKVEEKRSTRFHGPRVQSLQKILHGKLCFLFIVAFRYYTSILF